MAYPSARNDARRVGKGGKVKGNEAQRGAGTTRAGAPRQFAPGSRLAVYTVVEVEDRSIWRRVGAGYVTRDGSFNLYLEALPVNGRLHVREIEGQLEGEPATRGPTDRGEEG